MDGVSAFVNGLHWFINGLVAGLTGVIVLCVSLTLYFSNKSVKPAVPVTAVTGTILFMIAVSVFGLSGFTGGNAGGIVIGIISLILTALIVFYDIKVIAKFLKQKKNKLTEEQKNG